MKAQRVGHDSEVETGRLTDKYNRNTHQQGSYSKSRREVYSWFKSQGIARTQSPPNRNCTPESSTFGMIARVNPTSVQWRGLALGEPP